MPYNYNPADFQPQYGFIAAGAAALGGGIGTAVDKSIEYQRELDKAAKIAEENKEVLGSAYKTVKKVILRKAQKLQEYGVIPTTDVGQREITLMLRTIPKPEGFKNVRDYIALADKATGELIKELDAKLTDYETTQKQQRIGTEAIGAWQGQPEQTAPVSPQTETNPPPPSVRSMPGIVMGPRQSAQPQPPAQPQVIPSQTIPGVQPATGRTEAASRLPQDITEQQLKTNPFWAAKLAEEEEAGIKNKRLSLQEATNKRLERNELLGWANYNLRRESLESSQTKTAYSDVVAAEKTAAAEEWKLNEIGTQITTIESEIGSLKNKLEDKKLDPDDITLIEKKIEQRQGELNSQNKEYAAGYKGFVSADNTAKKANIAYETTLKDNPAFSEYKKGKIKAQETTQVPTLGKQTPFIPTQPPAIGTPALGQPKQIPTPPQLPTSQNVQPPVTTVPEQPTATLPALDVPNVTEKPIKGTVDIRKMTPEQIKQMEVRIRKDKKKLGWNDATINLYIKKFRERLARQKKG